MVTEYSVYHLDRMIFFNLTTNWKAAVDISLTDTLNQIATVGRHGKIYWWIPTYVGYDLLQFDSVEFIQGVLTMANSFRTDYRYYFLGGPFTYDPRRNLRTEYNIANGETKDIIPLEFLFNKQLEPFPEQSLYFYLNQLGFSGIIIDYIYNLYT